MHRYPTRYRINSQRENMNAANEQRDAERQQRKAQKLDAERVEAEKRAAKEQKREAKRLRKAEKEAAEALVEMAGETYCDACWKSGEIVSVPGCRDECCTMNVCAYGCTFTCFLCEDSWHGEWKDRCDWFWAAYGEETFPLCPTCLPLASGMSVFRSAAGLFPWNGLWPGFWIGSQ